MHKILLSCIDIGFLDTFGYIFTSYCDEGTSSYIVFLKKNYIYLLGSFFIFWYILISFSKFSNINLN